MGQIGLACSKYITRTCGVRIPWSPHGSRNVLFKIIVTFNLTIMLPSKQCKTSALVEDNVDTAEAVTHETITETTKSGITRIKTVLVPLVPIVEKELMRGDHVESNDGADYQQQYLDIGSDNISVLRPGKVSNTFNNLG